MIGKFVAFWFDYMCHRNLLGEIVLWYRFRKAYYPYEIVVIEAIRSHLSSEGQTLLDAQIAICSDLRRHPEGLELLIYPPGLAWEKVVPFPLRREEQLLAVVYLAGRGQKSPLKVKVWLVRGHVLSFEFGTSPYLFFAGERLAEYRPVVASVSMKCNPMLPEA